MTLKRDPTPWSARHAGSEWSERTHLSGALGTGAFRPAPQRSSRVGLVTTVLVSAILLLSGAIGVVLSWPSTPGGLAGDQPGQVRALALATAERAGSVHISVPGGFFDVGQKMGHQVLVTPTQGRVEILVIGEVAYLRADPQFLENGLGLSSSLGAAYGSRWLSFSPSDPQYGQVTAADTLASALAQVLPEGPVSLGPTTSLDGRGVVGMRFVTSQGASRVATTTYVATSAPYRIVSSVTRASAKGASVSTTASFSRWGEAIHLHAPKDAVAFSSISA